MGRKIRIGIDVGGTFTDAVAMDNEKYEIIGLKKIHTTHDAPEGVTAGVIQILKDLLKEINADADDVIFIAHGTTQATNALLEGDVAKIGIVAIGSGLSGAKSKIDADLGNIDLDDGKFIPTSFKYLNYGNGIDENAVDRIFSELKNEGINVAVVSEAFSVDNPEHEKQVADIATEKHDFLCTCTHEISKLYGLKARTKTAAINASILPKMIQTAEMTSKAVTDAEIKAPLMIMRSDGGVMHVNEIKKRPILTVLSGPAAGVAGALMYERISDGIFLEVGGTSTDISAIQNGKVITKYAKIGGHSTYVTSLDINTIGIAGGSMVYCEQKKIINVGPRSAHIAGLSYACFEKPGRLAGANVVLAKPTEKDSSTALILECPDHVRYAVTLTCAANYLGLVPDGDYAHADSSTVKEEFDILSEYFGIPAEKIADEIMKIAIAKVAPAVQSFIKEYGLDKNYIYLCGGGGGASAVVPYLASSLGMKFKIVKNAPYISTIGAALAMVRDTVERTIINPTESDFIKIREEALQAVIKAGAEPSTVSIDIEVDSTKNVVRAIAVGTTDINSGTDRGTKYDNQELIDIVSQQMNCQQEAITKQFENGFFFVYGVAQSKKKLFGLLKTKDRRTVVMDNHGVIRLNLNDAQCFSINTQNGEDAIAEIIEANSIYDETGKVIPDLYLISGVKLLNMCGLQSTEQAMAIISVELKLNHDAQIGLIISRK